MRLPQVLMMVLAAALAGAVGLAAAAAVDSHQQRGSEERTFASEPDAAPPTATWAAKAADRGPRVLAAWDRRRAAAWTDGDLGALRELYVDRSVAGARDVAMLRRWRARGLRVRGLQTQVLSLDSLVDQPDRLVLRVTDRLVGGMAVGGGRQIALPRDRASTRRVVLVRQAGQWRVATTQPAT